MERMRAGTETLYRESKLAERSETVFCFELGDVGLTCGFCGHVLDVHTDSILMRRTETRWERSYMMVLMSFGSFPSHLDNALKQSTKKCTDISKANFSSVNTCSAACKQ